MLYIRQVTIDTYLIGIGRNIEHNFTIVYEAKRKDQRLNHVPISYVSSSLEAGKSLGFGFSKKITPRHAGTNSIFTHSKPRHGRAKTRPYMEPVPTRILTFIDHIRNQRRTKKPVSTKPGPKPTQHALTSPSRF